MVAPIIRDSRRKLMRDEERLLELLERWEELQRQGQDTSARELCAGYAELQPQVERAIVKLKRANPHLNLESPSSLSPPAPEQGSAGRSSPWPWVSKGSSAAAARTERTSTPDGAELHDDEVPVT